ncbi:MAG: coproporphyrinogen dehydrogenase HemZ [Clostridiales bacterium]|nr:coproporphyrinogen dehydrogenase HemZ [Clostridiales bacterium]
MRTAKIELLLQGIEERMRYELQMLIREFLPFAAFDAPVPDIRITIRQDQILWEENGVTQVRPVVLMEDHSADPLKNRIKSVLYDLLTGSTGYKVPWGTLTGVRPTKIAWSLLDLGFTPTEVKDHMQKAYRLSEDKADLMTRTAVRERSLMSDRSGNDVSVYIGIPFCPTRCAYCSFVSYDHRSYEKLSEAYMEALLHELEACAPMLQGRKLQSFYMGGGTPTTLQPAQMDRLLTAVDRIYGLDSFTERTVEAGRPDTIHPEILRVLKDHGIDRISINPQTMHQKTLDLIGRYHTVEDVVRAYELARKEGFDNINMDLILGLPEETVDDVSATMECVRALGPDSLTVHTLAIKRSSKFYQEDGEQDLVAQAPLIGEMIDISRKTAASMGLEPYYMYRQKNMAGNFENVGYSQPRKECLYNIEIMEERQSIVAFGAGGVSKIYYPTENRLERAPNVKNVSEYIARVDEMIERKRKELLHG